MSDCTDLTGAWQPIDTVPRDGTMVLFWSRDGGHFAGNWPIGYQAGVWSAMRKGFCGASDWRANTATHWAPLPRPPEDA